ncbi:MAG: hypothetical protein F6K10_19375 [Moorea sp. SIO2B7]|nr:hypothetical protein [Moorena sp. SIO2B7]
MWKSWLADYRWVYNWTIAQLKEDASSTAYTLQAKCRESFKPQWVKLLPQF